MTRHHDEETDGIVSDVVVHAPAILDLLDLLMDYSQEHGLSSTAGATILGVILAGTLEGIQMPREKWDEFLEQCRRALPRVH